MTQGESGDRPAGPGDDARTSPLLILGGLTGLVAFLAVLVFVLSSTGGGDREGEGNALVDEAPGAGLATGVPSIEATIDLSRPTMATAQNMTAISEGDRFLIAKFGVDAPLTYRNVGLDGVMPNPDGPDDIAYYDFSAWPGKGGAPGKGGNGVFAGHVDSGLKACKKGTVPPPCQAVLWDLNGLKIGDEIEVRVSGQANRYRVTSNQPVPAATGPWDAIVASTATETITIITCGGDFNRETREYSNRQVVTAERV